VIEPELTADQKQSGKGTEVYEKHIKTRSGIDILSRDFLKKYVSFVKAQKPPELRGDCVDFAAKLYAALRGKAAKADQNKVSVPITVRTLETIIRLATAHAKMRLSREVSSDDIQMAVSLLLHTIFQEEQEGLNEKFDEKIEEADMEEEDSNIDNTATAAIKPSFPSNAAKAMGRRRVVSSGSHDDLPDNEDKKQKKGDNADDVDRLFSMEPMNKAFDIEQKRLVFKIANKTKDGM